MEIVIRASVILLVLWAVTRGLGKRELAEMSPFELVLLVTIGDLVQQAVTQEDYSLTGAILAVATFSAWILVMSLLDHRSKVAAKVLDGEPVVLLRSGRIDQRAMRQERISEEELKAAARSKGVQDLGRVDAAVLETDGRISFLTTADADLSSRSDDEGSAT